MRKERRRFSTRFRFGLESRKEIANEEISHPPFPSHGASHLVDAFRLCGSFGRKVRRPLHSSGKQARSRSGKRKRFLLSRSIRKCRNRKPIHKYLIRKTIRPPRKRPIYVRLCVIRTPEQTRYGRSRLGERPLRRTGDPTVMAAWRWQNYPYFGYAIYNNLKPSAGSTPWFCMEWLSDGAWHGYYGSTHILAVRNRNNTATPV